MNIKWYAYYELSSEDGACDCDWGYSDSKEDAMTLARTYAEFGVLYSGEYDTAVVFVCQAPEQDMDDDEWMLTNHIIPGTITTLVGAIPSAWAV